MRGDGLRDVSHDGHSDAVFGWHNFTHTKRHRKLGFPKDATHVGLKDLTVGTNRFKNHTVLR